jgi:hypothetical protein
MMAHWNWQEPRSGDRRKVISVPASVGCRPTVSGSRRIAVV